MKRLLNRRELKIHNSKTPIEFCTTGDKNWKVWDRFIAVSGQNIYHIGNICNTCDFFFERLTSIDKFLNIDSAVLELNKGLSKIDTTIIETIKQIIPNGEYEVLLLTIKPKFVLGGQQNDYFSNEQVDVWGIDGYYGKPFSPKANYYRGADLELTETEKMFEFLIPLTSDLSIDDSRKEFFKTAITSGQKPTAISLSILDIKEPAIFDNDDIKTKFTSHWCLAHYILDGHHKIKSASELNEEITILSFLSYEQGISDREQINKLINKLI